MIPKILKCCILVCGFVGVIAGPVSPVTKITTIFDLFNPISLVKFFEFNDREWNISGECIRDMFWYLEAIEQDYTWPLKLSDASGSYGGGLNQQRLVDRGRCEELDRETRDFFVDVKGNADVSKVVPYSVGIVGVKYRATILDRNHSIHYSICFTRSCSEKEFWHIFEYNPILSFDSSSIGNVTLEGVRIIKDSWNIDWTRPNILYLIFSCSLFLGVILYSGLAEKAEEKPHRPSRRKTSPPISEVIFFDVVLTFFSSFSPRRISREFRVDYGTSKPVLHEFRVLSVFFITLAHTVRMFLVVSGDDFPRRFPILWTLSSEASSYSWDLIYFLVGFYLAFHVNGLLKVLSGSGGGPDMGHLHLEDVHHFVIVFAIQLIRTILPYIVIMCLAQFLGGILKDYSLMELPSVDHEFCATSGWKNLLFLDQFLPVTKRCAPWTWFISVEFYCSVIVLLLVMLTRRTQNYGMIISSSFFICSILLSVCLDRLPAATQLTPNILLDQEIRAFNSVPKAPWIFIGPFLLGKYTGELCYKTKCDPKMSDTLRVLGWILSFLVSAIIVSGRIAFGYFDEFKSLNVGFKGLSQSLFCVVISWLVIHKLIAGINWKWTRPLSKLSTICLLVHPILVRLFVILLGGNAIPSPNAFVIIVLHLGLFGCTIGVAGVLYSIYEAPYSVFKRRYVRKFILKQF